MKQLTAITAGVLMAAAFAPAPAAAGGLMAAPAERCAMERFGGVYAGGHVGGAYYDTTWSERDGWAKQVDDDLPSSVSSTDHGFVGGAQVGYNMQQGCTVFGVVADWSWLDVGRDTLNTDGDVGANQDTLRIRNGVDWLGTIRANTGVVVDNLLLYVTGGIAYADVQHQWELVDTGVASETFQSNDTRWGGTAGVGTNWAVTDSLSIVSEALYIWLEDDSTNVTSAFFPADQAKQFDTEDQLLVGRIGVNVKLGGLGQ